jgi:small subunit ribosomal protein S1
MADKSVLSLFIKEANKGGLIVNWQGLVGFVPVSQLSGEHYPKVSGGDKNRILTELEKLVNERLDLTIINVDPVENKIIFSEKHVDGGKSTNKNGSKRRNKNSDVNMMEKYSIGDILDAEVIGVVDFGVFCKLPQ